MAVHPPNEFAVPAAISVNTGRPPSSTAISLLAMNGVNHLQGNIVGGLRMAQHTGSGPTAGAWTARGLIYRHPNVDWVDVIIRCSTTSSPPSGSNNVTVTVGISTPVVVDASEAPHTDGFNCMFCIRAPITAGTTSNLITVAADSNVYLIGLWVIDVPRSGSYFGLDVGNNYVDSVATIGGGTIGLIEGRAIANASLASPLEIIDEIETAWYNYYPQMVNWWDIDGLAVSTTAYGNPFSTYVPGFEFEAKNRQLTDESTHGAYWQAYTWCDSGVTYDIRLVTDGDSTTVTGLTNTSGAWTGEQTIDVRTDANDSLALHMRRTAGSGACYISSLSVMGHG